MANDNYTNTISKTLKIIHINVNSIISLSRRYDLQRFLSEHNPDIVLLNETKLNPRHNVTFFNYTVIRYDRNGAIRGGGTAILIRNNIKFKVHTNYRDDSFCFLEAGTVKIPMTANKILYIISAYYPAGNNDTHIKTDMDRLFG